MSATNSVVTVYDSHVEAERAIEALQQAGLDMKSLSIAGRDTHTDEHVVSDSYSLPQPMSRSFQLSQPLESHWRHCPSRS
jgi:hypothetical protein